MTAGMKWRIVTSGTLALAAVPSPALASGVWTMDEPAGATVMLDISGSGNDGRIPSGVTTGVGVYTFSGGQPVSVPTSGTLNPYGRDFSYAIRVRRTGGYPDPNLLQKGHTASPNGYFKVDYYRGGIGCTVSGSLARRTLAVPLNLSDGLWHSVKCTKTADQLRMDVDWGTPSARTLIANVTLGQVANIRPVTIGGKARCSTDDECDPLTGQVAWARIDL